MPHPPCLFGPLLAPLLRPVRPCASHASGIGHRQACCRVIAKPPGIARNRRLCLRSPLCREGPSNHSTARGKSLWSDQQNIRFADPHSSGVFTAMELGRCNWITSAKQKGRHRGPLILTKDRSTNDQSTLKSRGKITIGRMRPRPKHGQRNIRSPVGLVIDKQETGESQCIRETPPATCARC